MDRRGFIQSFIGAAALAMVPEVRKPPILLHDAAHHDLTGGFGLVQAKAEGASIPYDPGLTAEFPKAIRKGLTEMFGDVYEDLRPESFEKLWIDDEDEEV